MVSVIYDISKVANTMEFMRRKKKNKKKAAKQASTAKHHTLNINNF